MQEKSKGNSSQLHYVYWHDTDIMGHMNFAALARYLQETAWQNAEQLGYGFDAAMGMNRIWALIRQWIRIYRFPTWKEKIMIETWPRGVDGFWALRDYYIKDEKGEILGGITSSWMLINTLSKRPEKPIVTEKVLPFIVDLRALSVDAPKIEYLGHNELLDFRKVRYSDIDLHGHVNNSRYVEWIFDALSTFGLVKSYTSFQINHLAEAIENDELEITISTFGETVFVKAVKVADSRIVFIARLDL